MATEESLTAVAQQQSQLGQAMQQLESAVAAPAAKESWTATLLHHLRQLETVFTHHVDSVQSPSGLLDRIVDQAPRLQRSVEARKLEHVRIATSISDTIQSTSPDGPGDTVIDIRESVMELIVDLSRYRQKGADLIYDAYAVDIGGY